MRRLRDWFNLLLLYLGTFPFLSLVLCLRPEQFVLSDPKLIGQVKCLCRGRHLSLDFPSVRLLFWVNPAIMTVSYWEIYARTNPKKVKQINV